jgi:creatinine amidohydrolase/Fe(II)-dependent formamide hydrolase-like protein
LTCIGFLNRHRNQSLITNHESRIYEPLLIDLTQPEIAAQLRRNPLVILPAGSVEQHGPHLPAGTDIYAANVISHAVAERMDGLVLPGGPLGVTPMHMPFEATITLSPETYQRVVVETGESTAKHGAKRLLILNWHEGNIPSLAIASEKLHRDVGMSVIVEQACYVAAELYGHDCGRPHARWRDRSAGGARPIAPTSSTSTASRIRRTTRTAGSGTAAPHPQLPARAAATSGPSPQPAGIGVPARATVAKGPEDAERHRRCDREGSGRDLQQLLDEAQGGKRRRSSS